MLLSLGEEPRETRVQNSRFDLLTLSLFFLSAVAVLLPGGRSKAVLFLGQLRLSCSEEQLLVLIGRLTHILAFGPISSWGTDVFIEIGVLAGILPFSL